MLLDIVFAVVLVLAIVKGYQRGLIVGLFSLVSVIIGLAAAVKLSTAVAGYIGETVKVSAEWLPVIAFAAVFIVVVILIRLGANAIQKAVEVVMLGWLNKLAGDQPIEEDAYSIEDVPWTQYFHNSVALHGAFWHGGFGLVRSHGCVNLSPATRAGCSGSRRRSCPTGGTRRARGWAASRAARRS